jgi:hypothetical protein
VTVETKGEFIQANIKTDKTHVNVVLYSDGSIHITKYGLRSQDIQLKVHDTDNVRIVDFNSQELSRYVSAEKAEELAESKVSQIIERIKQKR